MNQLETLFSKRVHLLQILKNLGLSLTSPPGLSMLSSLKLLRGNGSKHGSMPGHANQWHPLRLIIDKIEMDSKEERL